LLLFRSSRSDAIVTREERKERREKEVERDE